MKNIQSLTLVMMVVMVYTKTIHNGTLSKNHKNLHIDQIIEAVVEVKNKLPKNETILVPMISSDQNGPCVKEFFCLAEKALNETKEAQRLIRVWGSYNKKHGHVHSCKLNTRPMHHLEKFLEVYEKCLEHLKNEE